MSSDTKTFDLGTVLSVTTGRLLTGIGNLYEILGHMTDDVPFTHQLPRFNTECEPWLLRWFPELEQAKANLAGLDGRLNVARRDDGDFGEAVDHWLASLNLPPSYDVPRIPKDDHERKNALDELVAMVGPEKVVPIVIPDTSQGEGERRSIYADDKFADVAPTLEQLDKIGNDIDVTPYQGETFEEPEHDQGEGERQ